MKKNIFGKSALLFLFSFLLSVVFAGAAEAKKIDLKNDSYVPGQLIIKFKAGQSPDGSFLAGRGLKSADKILKRYELKSRMKAALEASGEDRLYISEKTDASDLRSVLDMLNNDPRVEYAEPNYIIKANVIPNDPSFSSLWGMNNTGQTGGTLDADVDAPEAWNIQTGSASTVIGVIDTGIDYNHSDLAANIWTNPGEIPGNGIDDDSNGFIDDVHGWDFYNNDSNPMDDNGHGTHVAGTIGAVGNNGAGVAGVNWSVKIAALKFLNSSGSGSTVGAINAVNYANMMGFKVTSNSWGGGGFSQALYDAIAAANTNGDLFVAAAGNDGSNNDAVASYPASYDLPNIISVAATDHNDAIAYFSNYGLSSVDIAAPGVNIYSTTPGNTYGTKSGTSMATPHVSGVVGLVLAQFPSLDANGVKARILNGADPIPSLDGKILTGGRLNSYNALEEDSIPPSAISDLAATAASYNSVTLSWTAKGDDGDAGKANGYDIRYSSLPITDFNWDGAAKALGEPRPQTSGAPETFKVMGLSQNSVYYFAVKSIDNTGNVSGLSNLAEGTTTIPMLVFQDNMENGINGWTHGGANDNWAQGAITSGPGSAYSGSNAWATNPSGNYNLNNMNAWLSSPSFSLAGVTGAELDFQHYYGTEPYYDGGIVEISANGGVSWAEIYPVSGYPEAALSSGNPMGQVPAYSGNSGAGWHKAVFDLSNYDGTGDVRIRFRFGTDFSVANYPGWYMDDFEIYGNPPAANNKPIAVAGGPYTGLEGQSVAFDGSGSFDSDGNPLAYKWNFGDGNTLNGTSSLVNHVYSRGGVYNVTLIVNDGIIDSDPSAATADITEVNDAPIANAGSDQTVILGNIVTFNGSLSSDEEGPIASYYWDFGDGSSSIGAIVTHKYGAIGNFTATLTVTDAGGLTAQDTVLVTVSAADTVTVTKATYSSRRRELTVEAKSTQNGVAVLTLQGFGQMTYNSSLGLYQYKKRFVSNPGTVTVSSSLGGTVTRAVTLIK